MQIQYVANACFRITLKNGTTLLVDPWFAGPAQQTWYNFPPVHSGLQAEIYGSNPDYIYISHLHYDHLHAQTLTHFDRRTPIIIGRMNTPNLRSALIKMGFTTLIEINFEEPYFLDVANCKIVMFKDFHGTSVGDESVLNYDLDTSMIIYDSDGTHLFNGVDNSILPDDAARIARQYGRPDVAILPYASASLYPMAMADYGDEKKLVAMHQLRHRVGTVFRDVVKEMRPGYVLPAGGEYVLGGPAAPLSRFLPQPLVSDLRKRLAEIDFAPDKMSKLCAGDIFDTATQTIREDTRALHRDFTDETRLSYALTLAQERPDYLQLRLPPGMAVDWNRVMRKCAQNFVSRVSKCDFHPALDLYMDCRSSEDWDKREFLFRLSLDTGDAGLVSSFGPEQRARQVYEIDDKLLFCLVNGMLNWNALESSALIKIRRKPDEYHYDLHRFIVYFCLVA